MSFTNKLKNFIQIIIKYKLSIIFTLIFIIIFKQNIIINKFPIIIKKQEKAIAKVELEKNKILAQNKELIKNINAYKDKNLILIESQARYKYGLIKENEVYYQIINKTNN